MAKYSDIKRMTRSGHYKVNVFWNYLEKFIDTFGEGDLYEVDLNPDFQRGHVWTEEQQVAYVEFKLRGGEGSDVIQCNCSGWMGNFKGPYELIDGKQRLTAALKFLKNEIPVFGKYREEYVDKIPIEVNFIWSVNNLETREEVLRWYLEMNSGGTPHTKEELEKVSRMLKGGELNEKR